VGNGQVAWRQSHSGIDNVAALAQRVANVITSIDPDVLTLQEGPSDPREMDLFVNDFLSDANGQVLFDEFGGLDGGAQKVYTLGIVTSQSSVCELTASFDYHYANSRIAHVEYDAQEDASRPADDRDRLPSDHRPIVVEIN